MTIFTRVQIESIANALGDTENGLSGSEIGDILFESTIKDSYPNLAKRHRLFNALIERQNSDGHRKAILAFIRKSMKPARYLNKKDRYDPLRARLNEALSFAGLAIVESGDIEEVQPVSTLADAQRRAEELRKNLSTRHVHPDVLKFCRAELIADDYFHAVLEAAKSISDKIKSKTGLDRDGSELIDYSLMGDAPLLTINSFKTKTEISEQKGFAMLIKGIFSMFSNPTAHEPRIHRNVTRDEAEDFLTIVSLVHRRLDEAIMPSRVY